MGNPPPLPLQPGDPAPDFVLPSASQEGTVALSDLRGRPFLIGLFRGLHCPFCRRQVMQLAAQQPALQAAGVKTVAVINTPLERARQYYRFRPTPLLLLSDPECRTHEAFGVPRAAFQSPDSTETPQWPFRASLAEFEAARINPGGVLPEPTQPMAANAALNAKDGFEMEPVDGEIAASYGTQLVGHFLIDRAGTIAWRHIEAMEGPNGLCYLPNAAEIAAAVKGLDA
ncbi:redoxin domain-containing protein [Variovorax sp. Sphag1AA]|uniref:redoxin domain-containing protein n=1 Tax=Variovorax sp. Sphag1AA TaxID=2587027 RepID=UPI00160E4592|nr:redoxin domain-containing protein [Variovorax sp. Sphag1AA]MBB3182403.1 peroxiredoxin [Variovorax sp. Sphag1AA]